MYQKLKSKHLKKNSSVVVLLLQTHVFAFYNACFHPFFLLAFMFPSTTLVKGTLSLIVCSQFMKIGKTYSSLQRPFSHKDLSVLLKNQWHSNTFIVFFRFLQIFQQKITVFDSPLCLLLCSLCTSKPKANICQSLVHQLSKKNGKRICTLLHITKIFAYINVLPVVQSGQIIILITTICQTSDCV